MTPPRAKPNWHLANEGTPAAVSLRLQTLRKRTDFLKASRAPRVVTPGFVLQARKRSPQEPDGMRVGFTCSKKVGNAVTRNRAKRRLREIARLVLPELGLEGVDYVLIGRRDTTVSMPFSSLVSDLTRAVTRLQEKMK